MKCGARFRKSVSKITDRAKRYRANTPECLPIGPRRCSRIRNGKLCGSKRNLVVGHKDGNESNSRRSNLEWECKSCNTYFGKRDAKMGRGERTRQYNPTRKQLINLIRVAAAQDDKQTLTRLYVENRISYEAFKQAVQEGRRMAGKNPGAVNLAQYTMAAMELARGAHDAAGKILHETPKAKRRSFARDIWATRRARGTDTPSTGFRTNPKRKRNYASAADLYEQFHGVPAKYETDTGLPVVDYDNNDELGQLGRLVSLTVVVDAKEKEGQQIRWNMRDAPDVAAEKSGKQIYFVGGDQNIDSLLGGLRTPGSARIINLGPCIQIEYFTKKHFDRMRPIVYFHHLGEDSGVQPDLLYDRKKKLLRFEGGEYTIKPEGIVN